MTDHSDSPVTATERPIPPRWYMVNSYGVATLCVDESSARLKLRSADKLFPRFAPHVAVQLAPARTLDAAPADPVVSPKYWHRAFDELTDREWHFEHPIFDDEWAAIEQRARELAREGK
jgi:hypothetical protein